MKHRDMICAPLILANDLQHAVSGVTASPCMTVWTVCGLSRGWRMAKRCLHSTKVLTKDNGHQTHPSHNLIKGRVINKYRQGRELESEPPFLLVAGICTPYPGLRFGRDRPPSSDNVSATAMKLLKRNQLDRVRWLVPLLARSG
jgi:hypothetical protein